MTAVIILSGCASVPDAPKNLRAVTNNYNHEWFGTTTVDNEPEIKGLKPEVSPLSSVMDGVGYTKIFAGISSSDTTRLWNDWTIFLKTDVMEVDIFLNSGGGGAFDGIAIARHIMNFRNKGMTMRIHASGIVASAAIPILAAGSERFALKGTIFMVHEAALWKWPGKETASDIRAQAELMNLIRDSYMDILAETTTTSVKSWKAMEGVTTWFNADRAKEFGLIDHIE